MSSVNVVHVVVPRGFDDPARPSGGNAYDQRVIVGLRAGGWVVCVRDAPGPGTVPHAEVTARLGAALAGIPDGAVVLLDGLVASSQPEVLVPEGRRLRLVVLVHLPLGCGDGAGQRVAERAVLLSASGIVVTSTWSRDWLSTTYALPHSQIRVVTPGAEPASLVSNDPSGGRLLCVGAVTPTKGQDVLVEALAEVVDLDWTCRCVGSMAINPTFADRVRARAASAGLGDRLAFVGPRVGAALDAAYAVSDLVVVPSRTETYGMVVTEVLARGVPVVGSEVGGLPEALGATRRGGRPGLLVPGGDSDALADALRRWLVDAGLRATLRRAAQERRSSLSDWAVTTDALSRVLREVAA
ncbi:glycosyltransferase family 4 protein [Knoellia sp. S7-12]|uniref:glycosyltransferase family 4 protein n=1 Tax=Knoellia sp. S7-12 TaxID=3126698 RepID=UPI003368FAC5